MGDVREEGGKNDNCRLFLLTLGFCFLLFYFFLFVIQTAEPELQKLLCADLENRLYQLKQRLTTLRTESDEVWKTLETAESTLLEMLTAKDYDCSTYFGDNAVPASKPPETVSLKKRADRHETEEFYLAVSTTVESVDKYDLRLWNLSRIISEYS